MFALVYDISCFTIPTPRGARGNKSLYTKSTYKYLRKNSNQFDCAFFSIKLGNSCFVNNAERVSIPLTIDICILRDEIEGGNQEGSEYWQCVLYSYPIVL